MPANNLSVREIEVDDINLITKYCLTADTKYLQGMGVDKAKIPSKNKWELILSEQLTQSFKTKQSYCIIWEIDNKSVGHSNINKIVFGKEAYMHLHI